MTNTFALPNKKIWVAGDRGMVGSAIVRRLQSEDCQIITASRQDLDLRRQKDVEDFISTQKPDAIILAAATVGGIAANNNEPASFIYDNLMIESNIIHAAYQTGIEKLLFLGSSCIYPRNAANPITEDALLSGHLEPTNQWYATAKIAGIKLCQAYRRQYGCDFISAMPCNLYGPGDKFDKERSHVIPALLIKFFEAVEDNADSVTIWGTGTPRREFLYVDDLADALVFILQHYSDENPINVGKGKDVTIAELAELIAAISGFQGQLEFDTSRPDGVLRKLMDNSRLASLGWTPSTKLEDGLQNTWDWYIDRVASQKAA